MSEGPHNGVGGATVPTQNDVGGATVPIQDGVGGRSFSGSYPARLIVALRPFWLYVGVISEPFWCRVASHVGFLLQYILDLFFDGIWGAARIPG